MMPTVSPSLSLRSLLGGMTVVMVTGAALLPKNAKSPARGCTSDASSSMPGIRLTQPPPAERSARNSCATAATSGGVNSIVFVWRPLLTGAPVTPVAQ
jgi:hypothetical protein